MKAVMKLFELSAIMFLLSSGAHAELLALMNYESKVGQSHRREGITVIDVDPTSPNFNKIIKDTPLPPDYVAHHIYYNKDLSKAYVTSLGHSELYVYEMASFPEKRQSFKYLNARSERTSHFQRIASGGI